MSSNRAINRRAPKAVPPTAAKDLDIMRHGKQLSDGMGIKFAGVSLALIYDGLFAFGGKDRPNANELSENEDNFAAYMAVLLGKTNCVNPIEEMLVAQIAFAHARTTALTRLAVKQDQRRNVQAVNQAADGAANTFRRLTLALLEHRRPPRSESFIAVRQANMANQQVITNAQQIPENLPAIEKRSALPAIESGIEIASAFNPAHVPVAVDARAENEQGEGAIENERAKARHEIGGSSAATARECGPVPTAATATSRRRTNRRTKKR